MLTVRLRCPIFKQLLQVLNLGLRRMVRRFAHHPNSERDALSRPGVRRRWSAPAGLPDGGHRARDHASPCAAQRIGTSPEPFHVRRFIQPLPGTRLRPARQSPGQAGFRSRTRARPHQATLRPSHLWSKRPSGTTADRGGVPIVTVMCAFDNLSDSMADHWDTHHDNFNRMKKTMLPLFDRVFPALVDDLQQRGRLDETLIVIMGDFGRTPRINASGGRDHHPYCYSVAFAGGGIRGGQLHGSSDAIGAYPGSSPCGPHDVHATVFHALGIPLDSELRDQLDRPHSVCDLGRPLPLF